MVAMQPSQAYLIGGESAKKSSASCWVGEEIWCDPRGWRECSKDSESTRAAERTGRSRGFWAGQSSTLAQPFLEIAAFSTSREFVRPVRS
jgi:hypothetical protein